MRSRVSRLLRATKAASLPPEPFLLNLAITGLVLLVAIGCFILVGRQIATTIPVHAQHSTTAISTSATPAPIASANPTSSPISVTITEPTSCGTYDLGPVVGPTYLCPGTGTLVLASDGCDGGAVYAHEEVNLVSTFTHRVTVMQCGDLTWSAP